MIEQTAPTTQPAVLPMYPVTCDKGAYRTAQRISNVIPSQGYTSWCRSCKLVHMVTWDQLPDEVLCGMAEAINAVLVARVEAKA
jgi:hypothetical protein